GYSDRGEIAFEDGEVGECIARLGTHRSELGIGGGIALHVSFRQAHASHVVAAREGVGWRAEIRAFAGRRRVPSGLLCDDPMDHFGTAAPDIEHPNTHVCPVTTRVEAAQRTGEGKTSFLIAGDRLRIDAELVPDVVAKRLPSTGVAHGARSDDGD